MILNNNALKRAKYDELVKKYSAEGKEVSPHFLRMEAQLKDNVNRYQFEVKKVGGEANTERKLDRNDKFLITEMALGWLAYDEGKEAVAKFRTFAPADFPHHEAVYNGFLSLKTGSRVNIEALSTLNFKHVPEDNANSFDVVKCSYSGVENIILDGTKSHEIAVEFPTVPSMSIGEYTETVGVTDVAGAVEGETEEEPVTHTYNTKLCLMLFGYIIKNGADGLGA